MAARSFTLGGAPCFFLSQIEPAMMLSRTVVAVLAVVVGVAYSFPGAHWALALLCAAAERTAPHRNHTALITP